jgi:hypothetical protein
MCIQFVQRYIRTGRSCSPLLGRHAAVLVRPRTIRHRKPDGPHKGRTVRVEARTVRPLPGSLVCQAGTTVVLGRPQTVRQSKPDGPHMGRTVQAEARTVRPCSGAPICQSRGGGGTCPGYEFIGIPYNGWGYKSPFVADVLDIDIMLLVSYDGKLGATDFSNVRVNFLSDSSNPTICCFI